MDQYISPYVNIGLFLWPGLVFLLAGGVLFRAKNGILSVIGAVLVLAGAYGILTSIRSLDPTLAFAIVLVLAIVVGHGLFKSKGGAGVVGVILMILAGLGLLSTLGILIPNLDGGQAIRDALASIADFFRQLFGAADQGLGNLNQ